MILILAAGVSYGATRAVAKVRSWFEEPPSADLNASKPSPLGPQARPAGPAPAGMVWIPGGTYRMGTSDPSRHFADAPEHDVEVGGFWMDETEVTNTQFAEFVKATGYVTIAEQKPTLESIRAGLPPDAPDPKPEQLVPGSLVFTPPNGRVPNDHFFW